ncbi:hypothetical protein EI555_015573, partial [Monodon monoceros]
TTMPNFCAAPNCTRKSTQSDLAFFRFPRDPARCQKWVENCRRADLEDKTPDQLNKHYRLCAKHFETSMICRTSPYRTVLRDNAIPTIFDLTSHLNNPHSRHRKRIKELSEDEIRTLKQKKIDETSEQEPKHKEINNSNAQNPSAEEGGKHLATLCWVIRVPAGSESHHLATCPLKQLLPAFIRFTPPQGAETDFPTPLLALAHLPPREPWEEKPGLESSPLRPAKPEGRMCDLGLGSGLAPAPQLAGAAQNQKLSPFVYRERPLLLFLKMIGTSREKMTLIKQRLQEANSWLEKEEKGLEFFMDTFSELGAEAPNCIPQIPSTPHFKASVQDKKKDWPQTNSVSGTHFQPKVMRPKPKGCIRLQALKLLNPSTTPVSALQWETPGPSKAPIQRGGHHFCDYPSTS